jgi:hypothetical protein
MRYHNIFNISLPRQKANLTPAVILLSSLLSQKSIRSSLLPSHISLLQIIFRLPEPDYKNQIHICLYVQSNLSYLTLIDQFSIKYGIYRHKVYHLF